MAAGFNVTHSDADAVWVRDPFPLMDSLEADIVSSQGTIQPPSCHAVWGHVLCYGFIQFRSTPASLTLLREFAELAEGEGKFSDQISLNERLLSLEMEWTVKEPYGLNFREKDFFCSAEPIFGSAESEDLGRISVAILPHAQVQRLPNDVEEKTDAYVRHPLSQKNAEDIETVLRDQDCWFIERRDRPATERTSDEKLEAHPV
nr:putative nucleotide-diphospho-sugar transferase [Methyloligella halotolerans]